MLIWPRGQIVATRSAPARFASFRMEALKATETSRSLIAWPPPQQILHLRLKSVGTVRERGKPIATVESGKWAGPVMAPVSGTVVEVNAELEKDPGLLNTDPYGRGWIVRMTPSAPAEISQLLVGPAALAKFKEILEKDNIRCLRCQA